MKWNQLERLAETGIGFCVHYPTKKPDKPPEYFVVTVNESVNNEQLKVLVELGGNLAPDGIVQIIGELMPDGTYRT